MIIIVIFYIKSFTKTENMGMLEPSEGNIELNGVNTGKTKYTGRYNAVSC